MSDPLRSDPSRALEPVPEAERNAKIEQLLLGGLDHYFAARYEQAINVWTRALFLDRSHARARAYIERARSALSERQRESEELLETGLNAFTQGDTSTARRLLQGAIDQGAPPDEARAVLDRLDRLERGTRIDDEDRRTVDGAVSAAASGRDSRLSPAWLTALGVVLGVATLVLLAIGAGARQWAALLDPQPGAPAQTAPPFRTTAPELPRRGEMALERARAFAASGRLHDALAQLDRIRPTDREQGDADLLRADLQKQLLALAGLPTPATQSATSGVGQP